MLPFGAFTAALPYDAFLAQFGAPTDRAAWDRTRSAATLAPDQTAVLGTFVRTQNVLVLAGAWCGDCAAQCPIFERFAEASPRITVGYIDRDDHPDAQRELRINGGDRVPVAVFFSEDGFEVARYGERTLARYRQLVEQLTGESCATGLVRSADPVQAQVVQDWLDEFERVQWVLRLSPRLRRLRGD